MANHKACEEVGIAIEMMKYASDHLKEDISTTINKVSEQYQDELNIEKSILFPIPLQNKPP